MPLQSFKEGLSVSQNFIYCDQTFIYRCVWIKKQDVFVKYYVASGNNVEKS